MKIKNTKKLLTTPLLVGAICALVGGGLLLYYYLYAKDSSIASFVTCYAIVAVGALSLISIVFILIEQHYKIKTLKQGQELIAKYLSNDTNVSAQKTNYYSIQFQYELDNQVYTRKTKYEFSWGEVLTLKVVGEFKIRLLNGRIVLDEDLESLFENNKEKIRQEEQKYYDAQSKIEEILKNMQ